MKIIILSQYYYPEPVEKVHDLASGLVKLGHDVQVITGFPCYPKGKIYSGYKQKLFQNEIIDGVNVLRIPQFADHSRSPLRRALYYFSFAFSSIFIGLLKSQPADVIYVYQAALPIGLAGMAISRLRRLPYMLDVVDLWPESVIGSGMISNEIVIQLIRKMAYFIYANADRVNVVTEGSYQRLIQMGVPKQKLSIIHNWMPSKTYKLALVDSGMAKREKLFGRFNVVYAGSMGQPQNLQTLLDAAKKLENISEIQFVLIGDGLEHKFLQEYARGKEISNVLFLGRRPPESMAAFYALADVLVVHLKPDILSDISIPSKTFAYMASGRPILMAIRGDAEKFVKDNGFGLSIPPSEPAKMAEAVKWFYDLQPAERERIGQAALIAYKEKFCSDIQIEKVETILKSLIFFKQRKRNIPKSKKRIHPC